MMSKFDFLTSYTKLAPLQLSIVRSEEAWMMSRVSMPEPILDIGCGDGVFGQVLFKGKKWAVEAGIDVDEISMSLAPKGSVYKKVIKVDASQLPFPDKSFMTVMANESLEHILEIDQVLRQIARVLKDKGRLVFLVPTVFLDDFWLTSAPLKAIGLYPLARFFHHWRNKIFTHRHLLPVQVWEEKLNKAGLKLKSHQYLSSRKVYFISELLWPLRFPVRTLSRLLRRRILYPRFIDFAIIKFLKNFLKEDNSNKKVKGPTMIIIAQKK